MAHSVGVEESGKSALLKCDETWLEDLRSRALGSRERAPWLGGDLQTVAHHLVYCDRPIPAHETPMQFPLRDGSGERQVS